MTVGKRYRALINDTYNSDFQLPDPSLGPVLSAIPAIRNASVILTGIYGTGKTTLVEAWARRFFVDNGQPSLARMRCHQELMDTDTLYLLSFERPDAPVKPRAMLTRRFRYLNEIPRSNPALQNAMLSLFSEREVSFRDQDFPVPDGIYICDRNPDDIGQEGVAHALLDRIDFEIVIPNHSYRPPAMPSDSSLQPLSSAEMEVIWEEVESVECPPAILDYAHMLNRYFSACIHPRDMANRMFDLACEQCAHQGEICRNLRTTPGQRGIIALVRLAKALAWLDQRRATSDVDLETALPFVYSHRLDFHHEVLREWPNPQTFLRQFMIDGQIKSKREHWLEAIQARREGDMDRVLEIARKTDDLVVAWLFNLPQVPNSAQE